MLTLMVWYHPFPREMCVRAINGTAARLLSCVKHDGEHVETVL